MGYLHEWEGCCISSGDEGGGGGSQDVDAAQGVVSIDRIPLGLFSHPARGPAPAVVTEPPLAPEPTASPVTDSGALDPALSACP